MTVHELEQALVEFAAQNTYEMRFRSNEQTLETVPPAVWSGYIPRDEVGSPMPGEITVYPAIIVSATNGTQDWESETVTVNMMIGCFDAGLDQQGYRDCCNILQRLKDRLRESDIIRERFPLRMPLNWQLSKHYGGSGTNSFPYFFAEMQVNFELPVALPNQFDYGIYEGDRKWPGRLDYPLPPPEVTHH